MLILSNFAEDVHFKIKVLLKEMKVHNNKYFFIYCTSKDFFFLQTQG